MKHQRFDLLHNKPFVFHLIREAATLLIIDESMAYGTFLDDIYWTCLDIRIRMSHSHSVPLYYGWWILRIYLVAKVKSESDLEELTHEIDDADNSYSEEIPRVLWLNIWIQREDLMPVNKVKFQKVKKNLSQLFNCSLVGGRWGLKLSSH